MYTQINLFQILLIETEIRLYFSTEIQYNTEFRLYFKIISLCVVFSCGSLRPMTVSISTSYQLKLNQVQVNML